MHGFGVGAVVALLVSMAVAAPARAALNDTTLVSQGLLGAPAFDASFAPTVSADGRYVAFASTADNLVDGDNDVFTNAYVRDMQTGTTTLVSQPSGQGGGGGNDANSGQYGPVISGNGRFVVFESFASNLTSDDNDTFGDVFVRDMQTGTTVLASQPTGLGGGLANNGSSSTPVISADGRYVAFGSDADNLSMVDNDAVGNVFLRDMLTSVTTLVSQPTGGGAGANNGASYAAGVSADGRYVFFGSASDNMSDADNDAFESVFVRDLQASTTTLVSQPTGTSGCGTCNGDSYAQALSADGRYAAFESYADNLSANDGNAVEDVFVRDLQANTTTLVSLATGASNAAANDGDSFAPDVTDGGRYVVFESRSASLSAIDNDAVKNVFVRDLQTGVTTLASQPTGTGGAATSNGDSSWSAISNDGRYAAFSSISDTLSPLDADGIQDIFLRDVLGGPPSTPTPPPTPPPIPRPGTSVVPDIAPVLSAVSVSHRRFAAAARCRQSTARRAVHRCTRLRLRLSEDATITVKIERVLAGRRVGGRCVAPTRRNSRARRCNRYRSAGSITAKASAGRNRITFRGIVRGRALPPARYRLTVRARDAAGKRSRAVAIVVDIVRASR